MIFFVVKLKGNWIDDWLWHTHYCMTERQIPVCGIWKKWFVPPPMLTQSLRDAGSIRSSEKCHIEWDVAFILSLNLSPRI